MPALLGLGALPKQKIYSSFSIFQTLRAHECVRYALEALAKVTDVKKVTDVSLTGFENFQDFILRHF